MPLVHNTVTERTNVLLSLLREMYPIFIIFMEMIIDCYITPKCSKFSVDLSSTLIATEKDSTGSFLTCLILERP